MNTWEIYRKTEDFYQGMNYVEKPNIKIGDIIHDIAFDQSYVILSIAEIDDKTYRCYCQEDCIIDLFKANVFNETFFYFSKKIIKLL